MSDLNRQFVRLICQTFRIILFDWNYDVKIARKSTSTNICRSFKLFLWRRY